MVKYYIQDLTKLILELKLKNWDKKQIQVLQQNLDKAIKMSNEEESLYIANKDNNKPSNE
tara:strand:- start:390 stop:569 length:180 start_codon:yes stop_codon:yes gene_type:complete